MAIERLGEDGFVITGEDIGIYRLIALKARLKLELVGLKHRGQATSTILKKEFGWKGNRRALLAQLDREIQQRQEAAFNAN